VNGGSGLSVGKTEVLRKLKDAVVSLDLEQSRRLAEEALGSGVSPSDVVKMGLSEGLKEVRDTRKASTSCRNL
jgi:methanogenic corrinoid protein MtbC1